MPSAVERSIPEQCHLRIDIIPRIIDIVPQLKYNVYTNGIAPRL